MGKFFDNHSHSSFSDDGRMSVADALRAAKEKGLAGIAITDHYDFNVPDGVMLFKFNPSEQQERIIKEAAEIDGLTVLKGIEIGVQPQCLEGMRTLMANNSFDTVIASLHFIDGLDPFHGNYYKGLDYLYAYGHYLETFYQCISMFGDFDILGHFDYIARYAPYKETSILYSEFGDIFDKILRKLVEGGKTFEINTKTYQLYLGREPRLDIEILRRFHALGGEFISFGSDAHETLRIGENFERFIPMALEAGIKYGVYYKERKATVYPLK